MTTTRQPVRIATVEVNELNSCLIEFDIVDENGNPVPKAAVSGLTIDLYDDGTGDHINGRLAQSILDENGGTYGSTNGHVTMTLEAADNPIVGTLAIGRREPHTALFALEWGGGSPPARRWSGEVKLMVANMGHVPTS